MNQSVRLTPAVIQRVHPILLRDARRMLPSPDAEDAVQATWVSALHGLSRFDGRSTVLTWMRTILRRRVIDHWRRLGQTEPLEHDTEACELMPTHDLRRAVERASGGLQSLSEREREAVWLVDVKDQDRAAVAEQMQVTQAHLRVILFRARAKLAAQLADDGFTTELFETR